MSSRKERMAQNEAALREINEDVEGMHRVDPPGRRIQIVCECALDGCGRVIAITVAEYRQVRGDPRQFAIVPEHVVGDIERIVSENDRFAVVAKRQGSPPKWRSRRPSDAREQHGRIKLGVAAFLLRHVLDATRPGSQPRTEGRETDVYVLWTRRSPRDSRRQAEHRRCRPQEGR